MILTLIRDTGAEIETHAYCMIAKDGEEVDFHEDCICEGQVEVWLTRLMTNMRETIRYNKKIIYIFGVLKNYFFRHCMTKAVKAYEVKARDQWLFDYPAQVSLCGTQIWWTSEVTNLFHYFTKKSNT